VETHIMRNIFLLQLPFIFFRNLFIDINSYKIADLVFRNTSTFTGISTLEICSSNPSVIQCYIIWSHFNSTALRAIIGDINNIL